MPNTVPDPVAAAVAEALPRLDVVAAVIRSADGALLLARRPSHKHQGGRWEFPGGKVEPGEDLHAALVRELDEELGIQVGGSRPFMTVDHRYPDLRVRLFFREVIDWQGEPHGREGQAVDWFPLHQLSVLEFPAANRPIVSALQLSDQMLVMPASLPVNWQERLQKAIHGGCGLVYLRAMKDRVALTEAVAICRHAGALSLIADDQALMELLEADGLHLTSAVAACCLERPSVPFLSVSCHSYDELQQALRLQADMVTLSPVMPTPTHPDAEVMGWPRFAELVIGQPCAIYALGGIGRADLDTARQHGARGIAGIRGFW
ncbi:MAG: NUDIX hydrolase [Gammaproteobacteria bacterium HGW-Gammaproteobacteria-14]|nr:MAG: NUDIX hydrolase [Gammaproteobacteria bacterium HGW-Gammaproteobacteria-14]